MLFNPDFKDMLLALSEANVDYLLVGAYAVAAHGHPRATGDLDLWVRPDAETAPKVYRVLAEFGAPLHDLTVEDLAKPGMVFQIGVEPSRIDILTAISGVSFDDAWPNRLSIEMDGIPLCVLARNDLGIIKLFQHRRQHVVHDPVVRPEFSMHFDDPIWLEVVRLTRKFFPESRGYIHSPADLNLDTVYEMLRSASPDLKRVPYDVNLEDFDLYNWTMETASFSPCGRAVVVPECEYAERVPFICDSGRVAERINEGVPAQMPDGSSYNSVVFSGGADTFIVFESGEAFLADHHEGICWARSKINALT